MITAGSLFGKVSFYCLVLTPDAAGGLIGSYTLVLSTRASVLPLAGRRSMEEGQPQEIKGMQFSIRWRKDMPILSTLILVYNGLPYSIYSVIDVGNKRQEFQILAKAKEGLNALPLTSGGVLMLKPGLC